MSGARRATGGLGPGQSREDSGATALVEERMAVPRNEGDGLFLLLCRLETVQEPAPAVHVEHGGVATPLLPVARTDGVKIL